MDCWNGVTEFIGKMLACKSGDFDHSTQCCSSTTQPINVPKHPYMAEACGGYDDADYEKMMDPPRKLSPNK